jgi:hypothetical protein
MRRFWARKALLGSLILLVVCFLSVELASANVDLLYFRAVSGSDSITLEWETASELDNLGFNIYRSENVNFQDALVLNETLIPSLVGGQPIGAIYEWIDLEVELDITYNYWLQDIDFNGGTEEHGPVEASILGGNPIPTQPPINTVEPTVISTSTPEPTATATTPATSQVDPTSTSRSQNTSIPTATPTRLPVTSTAIPTLQTRQAENNQQTPEIPTPESVETEESPAILASPSPAGDDTTDPEVVDQPPTDIVADSVGQVGVPAVVANSSGSSEIPGSRDINAQSIGGENRGSVRSENAAETAEETSSRPQSLALIILAAALVLAVGAGIGVWLMLKPQTADQENDKTT